MNYRPTQSPVAVEAFPFAFPLAVASFLAFLLGYQVIGVLLFFFFVYVIVFFRNPQRYGTRKPGAVLAGADGKIVAAGIVQNPEFEDGQCLRIAIFMSLFDCHINWSPYAGKVEESTHHLGKFLNAMDDKCSDDNERKVIKLRTPEGYRVIVKLVAGLVARRIVCPIEAGDELASGEKVGLIRFGSRVEILLPAQSKLLVQSGMMVRGGETIVANLPDGVPPGYSELRAAISADTGLHA